MKRVKVFALVLSALSISTANAQEIKNFNHSGKVSAQVFTNYSAQIIGDDVKSIGFNLDRAAIGYKHSINDKFSANVVFDVGTDKSLAMQRYAYFKIASGSFKFSTTSVDFGLIGLNHHSLQEKAWGHRYVYKSIQDAYGWSNATDLGILVKQKLTDQIEIDLTIANGEGFKKPQSDLDFVYALGATIKPNDQLLFRFYGDYSFLANAPITLSSFVSLTPIDVFSIAGEFNHKVNNQGVANHDVSSVSLYATYFVHEKVSIYARFDKLWSKTLDGELEPWNSEQDGNILIGGVEYIPNKNFKMAINYNGSIFDDKSEEVKNIIGVYTEIKF